LALLLSPERTTSNRCRSCCCAGPELERPAARAEGYRLADEKLKAKAVVVGSIADALFARRFTDKARIEGDELAALLAGGG
jgi:hypothetical protein